MTSYDVGWAGSLAPLEPGPRRRRWFRRLDIALTVVGLLGVAALALFGVIYGVFLASGMAGCPADGLCLVALELAWITAAVAPALIFVSAVCMAIILLATHHTANGVPPVAAIISTLILLLVRGLTGA